MRPESTHYLICHCLLLPQVVFAEFPAPLLKDVLAFFMRHPPVVDAQAVKDAAAVGKAMSPLAATVPSRQQRKLTLEVQSQACFILHVIGIPVDTFAFIIFLCLGRA